MHQRARTDLRGGRGETRVPTATHGNADLVTFRMIDSESGGTRRPRTRPTMVSQGACGADLYYPQNPPAVSAPVYQASPPRPRAPRPAYKYGRS